MAIALYFGSFNPIHIGHLIIANSVLLEKEIDQVWFVVSPQNPFKKSENLLPEQQRYYLTQIATDDNPKFRVSNIEFSMPKPSYTIDTLNYLSEKYPTKKFAILIGGDNLTHFHKWKNYEQILERYLVYVYRRPLAELPPMALHPHVRMLDVPMMDISSTLIRERIQKNASIRYLVPDNVIDEIEKGRFYK